MVATPPAGKRSGITQATEANRWLVTLAGAAHDYPPTDEAGFLAFARSLASPELHQAIERAEPISPIRGYRRTENRLRHYERLPTRQGINPVDVALAAWLRADVP